MAHVLMVYATQHGQTEKIARRIAAALGARGHEVQLVDAEYPPKDLELGRFHAALVGAPIYVGSYPRSVVRFVRQHRDELDRVPSAFFSVNLAVASRTTDGRAETTSIVEKFLRQTGWRPGRVELFAGALVYSRYNFLIRFVMRRIAARAGGDTDTSRDYEYTDWQAVDRFAAQVMADAPGNTAPSRPRFQAETEHRIS